MIDPVSEIVRTVQHVHAARVEGCLQSHLGHLDKVTIEETRYPIITTIRCETCQTSDEYAMPEVKFL